MSCIDVSVVIPTFRREREVCEAIQSALAQPGVSVECIVLDDTGEGSAQEAVSAIGDTRVTYIKREVPSRGRPAIARNEGARLAKGRFLHFLDDDDHVHDGAYRDLVSALDARPERGVAFGQVDPFGDDPWWLKNKRDYFENAARVAASTPDSQWTVAHILFIGTLMVNSACIIRRECFEPLGGFDPGIQVYEDVDLWLRAIRRYGHVFVGRPVLHYRTGKPSLMHDLGRDATKPVRDSNFLIHQKYRREHGQLEYRAMQLLVKTLPFAVVRKLPAP